MLCTVLQLFNLLNQHILHFFDNSIQALSPPRDQQCITSSPIDRQNTSASRNEQQLNTPPTNRDQRTSPLQNGQHILVTIGTQTDDFDLSQVVPDIDASLPLEEDAAPLRNIIGHIAASVGLTFSLSGSEASPAYSGSNPKSKMDEPGSGSPCTSGSISPAESFELVEMEDAQTVEATTLEITSVKPSESKPSSTQANSEEKDCSEIKIGQPDITQKQPDVDKQPIVEEKEITVEGNVKNKTETLPVGPSKRKPRRRKRKPRKPKSANENGDNGNYNTSFLISFFLLDLYF